jgi:hypothetical protein
MKARIGVCVKSISIYSKKGAGKNLRTLQRGLFQAIEYFMDMFKRAFRLAWAWIRAARMGIKPAWACQ